MTDQQNNTINIHDKKLYRSTAYGYVKRSRYFTNEIRTVFPYARKLSERMDFDRVRPVILNLFFLLRPHNIVLFFYFFINKIYYHLITIKTIRNKDERMSANNMNHMKRGPSSNRTSEFYIVFLFFNC